MGLLLAQKSEATYLRQRLLLSDKCPSQPDSICLSTAERLHHLTHVATHSNSDPPGHRFPNPSVSVTRQELLTYYKYGELLKDLLKARIF